MMKRIISRSKAVEAPNEGLAVFVAVVTGTLRVAQREVSGIKNAAVLFCHQIRASEGIQGMFRRASNRRATDASVLISNHAVPTNE